MVLAAAAIVAAGVAGCRDSPPPTLPPVAAPPELTADAAIKKAAQDPKYADFRALVAARQAAAADFGAFQRTLRGRPLTDAERTKLDQLFAAVGDLSGRINAILSEERWSDEERRTLLYITRNPA
jgi:hypothetical protein